MTDFTLSITLRSDGAFGSGDGVAGVIDAEVQHDDYGLPYIGGRTLKGLMVEECVNILFALAQSQDVAPWSEAADRLFGVPGSGVDDHARLRIGRAQLPDALRSAVQAEIERPGSRLWREDVLASLTTIRRQTAIDVVTGAPQQETLRTTRVVLRKTQFVAALRFEPALDSDNQDDQRLLGLLAAIVLGLRRGGTERNRGRGALRATLQSGTGDVVTQDYFEDFFVKEVC